MSFKKKLIKNCSSKSEHIAQRRIVDSLKKSLRLFLMIMGGFFITIVLYIKKTNDKSVKTVLLSEERYTRVINVYNNRDEHNFLYVKFLNGDNELCEFPYKIGDSVSKKAGDSIEYIFRKNEILKHNFFDTARKNQSLTN